MTTAIKERPILFSGEMVRAILAGRKTQTRRAISDRFLNSLTARDADRKAILAKCPYGKPGDRLWVREAFMVHANEISYAATDQALIGESRWRPSIHMARSFCRLVLELTEIRGERLQAISVSDAAAEGFGAWVRTSYRDEHGKKCNPVERFATTWQRLNADRGYPWASNPFVWALTFKVVEGAK